MGIKRLTPDDAESYRALMLCAYDDVPETFTATVAERESLPMDFWRARVAVDFGEADGAPERVYGAFEGDELVGVAGLRFQHRPRTRHKAWLFGMYVLPDHRGRGLGRELLEAVLEGARSRDGVELIQLTVSESNIAGCRLYETCGFEPFGTEPMAIRVGDRYVAKVHMWRRIRSEEA